MDFLQWKIMLLVYYLILKSAHICDATMDCSYALGMESREIETRQITAIGLSPYNQVLDNARYSTNKHNSGLCFDKDASEKTLIVDFLSRVKINKIELQAPSNASVGDVTLYRIRYQDSGDHQIKQYGTVNFDIVNYGRVINLQQEPFVRKIFIDIIDFKNKPCLRIEFFGCNETDVCKPCLNGGKCIDYGKCQCEPNYAPPEDQCRYHFPDMAENPVLEVIKVSKTEVKFICKISQRSGVKHNASWIIDGKVVDIGQPTDQTILAELTQTILYDHLPTAKRTGWGIACQASACDSCPDAFSKPNLSNSLTPTIQVNSPKYLVRLVSKDISIKLAGPPVLFLQPNLARDHGSNIEIVVEFSADGTRKRRETGRECLAKTKHPVVEHPLLPEIPKQSCGPAVTSDDWNDPHRITIRAVDDGLFSDLNAKKYYTIILKHLDSGGNPVDERTLKKMTVEVSNNKPADGFRHYTGCGAYTDPHIRTFDGVKYLADLAGEFIMYRNKFEGNQVNLYFHDCGMLSGARENAGVTCVCGAAIKVGDDVIVVSSCPTQIRRSYEDTSLDTKVLTGRKYSFKTYIFLNGELTKGTRILTQANDVRVLLPTGTLVTIIPNWIKATFMDVYIEPSLKDKRSTEGLCGFYDGNCNGDLRDENYIIFNKGQSFPKCGKEGLEYREYVEKWRVPEKCGSLFRGTPKDTKFDKDKKPSIFCRCTKDSSSNDCGEHFDSDYCQPRKVEDITEYLVNNFSHKPKKCLTFLEESHLLPVLKKRRRRDVVPVEEEDDVYRAFVFNASYVPSNHSWPTKSGWTAVSAKKFCQDYLSTDAVKNCKKFANGTFESEIDSCMLDIKMSDGTTFARSMLRKIISECSSRAEKYPTDIFKVLPGGMKMEVLFDSLCMDNCSNHGVCKDGLCVCEDGYFGSECSMTKATPPTLNSMPRDGLCNSRRRNCSRSEIYGRGHIKSADLVCRVTPYDPVTGVRNDSGHHLTRAIYFNFNLLLCPHHDEYGSSYMVAVSNDNGTHYSGEELLFMSYDAACHRCTINQDKKRGNCSRLNTGCVIGKQCYLNNQTNPNNKCDICIALRDRNAWSLNTADNNCVKSPRPVSDDSDIALIAGLSAGVAVVVLVVIAVIVALYRRRRSKSYSFQKSVLSAGVAVVVLVVIAVIVALYRRRRSKSYNLHKCIERHDRRAAKKESTNSTPMDDVGQRF